MQSNAKKLSKHRGSVKKSKKALLIVMLMLLVTSLQSFASVSVQSGKVIIKENRIDLDELIWKLEKQTGYDFVFSSELLGQYKNLNVNLEGSIDEVLNSVLKDKDLTYEVENNIYIIRKAEKKPVVKQTQQKESKEIKGKVTDENNIPLPGVSVVIKGTNTGVASDIDGDYTLELESESAVLVFSFVGMSPQEVQYTGQAVINVVLQSSTESIGEVVATGYQTIKKGRATGSFQIINNEDINKVASVELTNKLEGIASGVKVNRNGDIVIRGKATLSAETEPLIVVDGFPWMGELSDINTEDIDQITVLKDAASAAIYGVRGANGVVVITTKKGKKNSNLQVSYTNSFIISEQPRLKDLDIMNSEQLIDLEWESYQRIGLTYPTFQNYKSEVGEIRAAMDNGTITESEAQAALGELASYNNRSDIEELFFRREMSQKHTVAFNYGSEKNQFYASVSFHENKTKWKGNDSNNLSFRLNDNFNFGNIFSLGLNVLGNYRNQKDNGQYASMTRPYVRFLDENGNYLNEAHGDFDKATRENYQNLGMLDFSYNQLQEKRLRDKEMETSNITTNVSFDIKPVKGVELKSSVGYNILNSRYEDFRNKESYEVRSLVNKFTDQAMQRMIPDGNILYYNDYKIRNYTLRTQLNLNKEIDDFILSMSAGLEKNSFKTENSMNNMRFNYNPQRLTESQVNWEELAKGFPNAYGEPSVRMYPLPEAYISEDRYLSHYFMGSVMYKGRYNIFGSYRMDKTNLFGQSPKYRDQPAWSAGMKWTLSEEDFFNLPFVNTLGIKGSFGLAGNVDKNTSPLLIAESLNDPFTGEPSLRVTNPENPELGWEKSYITNIGVDFALLDNKLSGSIEYYNKKTKDVLSDVAVDPTTGFGALWATVKKNNGEIVNRGVDANILVNAVSTKSFRYDINFNFSYNYNKVKKINTEANNRNEAIRGIHVKGEPVDFIYGYRNAGLNDQGEPQVYNRNGEVVPWNEMSELNLKDGKFFGRLTPPVFGSLTHSFTYKNFTADVFFTYDFGHVVKMYDDPNEMENARRKNVLNLVDKRWRNPGDEKFTSIPRLDNALYSEKDRINATWQSDFNIDDADQIRLKSINVSYDFTSLINSSKIKSLKLRAGIENLWHWTAASHDKIYDNRVAETNSDLRTVRSYYFPEYKNFTFGLSVLF